MLFLLTVWFSCRRWRAGGLDSQVHVTLYQFIQSLKTYSQLFDHHHLTTFQLPAPFFIDIMVQGKTKGLQAKAGSSRHAAKAAANTKKGKRAVAPKKPILVKQAAMHKVRFLCHKAAYIH